MLRGELDPWPGIAGGLANFEACDRRELVEGRISAGGARKALVVGGDAM